MAEREKFSAQAEEQLKLLRERLDSAKTKAEAKGSVYLRHFEEDLVRIESKYDLARYKLKLLRSGSGGAFHELRDGFEKAYHDLKEALGKALDKF